MRFPMDHDSQALSPGMQTGLGWYYLLVAVLNLGFALYWFHARKNRMQAALWGAVTGLFLVHAGVYLSGAGEHLILWQGARNALDAIVNPVSYFVLAAVGFALMLYFRKTWTQPAIAWALL